jgi:predicted lipoprotein with Yx(FWY)xxD motif
MKRIMLVTILTAATALAGCGGGGSSSTPTVSQNPGSHTGTSQGAVLPTATIDGGPAFVTSAGRAVYTFDGDTSADQSNCTGSCAAVWPPVTPPGGSLASPWSSFTRSDGSTQLAYNGQPLYTFTGDRQPDEATGNGVQGFHLARPESSATPTPGGSGY